MATQQDMNGHTESLNERIREVSNLILELNEPDAMALDVKLSRVLAVYRTDLERERDIKPGSAHLFERVAVADLLGVLVGSKLLAIPRPRSERQSRSVRMLAKALQRFGDTREALSANFAEPDLRRGHGLKERLWTAFPACTVEEATADAAAIERLWERGSL
jgi:hypothetical protein